MSRKLLLALALLCSLAAAPARAEGAASKVVSDFYATLSATMKQGEQLGYQGRVQKLDAAVRAAYNLPLMTKIAVGSGWAAASAPDQAAAVEAFSNFTTANYARNFAKDEGVQFAVNGEEPSSQGIIVKTSLKPKDGAPIPLNYLMRPDDKGHMRITDVYLNGTISELAGRRAEFSGIVRKDGMAALTEGLKKKAAAMAQ